MKTNKQKNLEHDAKQKARVRPTDKQYAWQELEAVVKQWVAMNEQA
jgi:hypothetical protein